MSGVQALILLPYLSTAPPAILLAIDFAEGKTNERDVPRQIEHSQARFLKTQAVSRLISYINAEQQSFSTPRP